MSVLIAKPSEIVDAGDDALPDQVMPDSVHENSRGQRVLRTGDPVGQLQSAALVFCKRWRRT